MLKLFWPHLTQSQTAVPRKFKLSPSAGLQFLLPTEFHKHSIEEHLWLYFPYWDRSWGIASEGHISRKDQILFDLVRFAVWSSYGAVQRSCQVRIQKLAHVASTKRIGYSVALRSYAVKRYTIHSRFASNLCEPFQSYRDAYSDRLRQLAKTTRCWNPNVRSWTRSVNRVVRDINCIVWLKKVEPAYRPVRYVVNGALLNDIRCTSRRYNRVRCERAITFQYWSNC